MNARAPPICNHFLGGRLHMLLITPAFLPYIPGYHIPSFSVSVSLVVACINVAIWDQQIGVIHLCYFGVWGILHYWRRGKFMVVTDGNGVVVCCGNAMLYCRCTLPLDECMVSPQLTLWIFTVSRHLHLTGHCYCHCGLVVRFMASLSQIEDVDVFFFFFLVCWWVKDERETPGEAVKRSKVWMKCCRYDIAFLFTLTPGNTCTTYFISKV